MKRVIRKNNGQALIEFILILPVFIFLIMLVIDFGNISYKKYELSNDLDIVVDFYKANESSKMAAYISLEDLSFTEEFIDDDMIKISLEKDIQIITPGLSNILGKDFNVSISRTIYEDSIRNE